MHAKDLVNQIKGYNSHETEIFDLSADLLLADIRNKLEDIYNSGQWSMMIGVTQLGIAPERLAATSRHLRLEFWTPILCTLVTLFMLITRRFPRTANLSTAVTTKMRRFLVFRVKRLCFLRHFLGLWATKALAPMLISTTISWFCHLVFSNIHVQH